MLPDLNYIKDKLKYRYNINIDTDNNLVFFDNLIIPNLYKENISDLMKYEFCFLLNKLFGNYYYENNYTPYENEKTKIKKGDIVFDCGANLGLFSLYALNKGAIVYSWEPNPLNLKYLIQLTKNYSNNFIIPCCVNNINGWNYFICCENYSASHLKNIHINENHSTIGEIFCLSYTLDKYCEFHKIIPNFIKADIEGAELNLLQGSKTILNNNISLGLITNHSKEDNKILTNFLTPYDYLIENYHDFLRAYKIS